MNEKYLFTGETKEYCSRTLRRICAKKDFQSQGRFVKSGELGGWIEDESCLSQEGSAWVADNSFVTKMARISGNAIVSGEARIDGSVYISDNVSISDHVRVECNQGIIHIGGLSRITDSVVIDCRSQGRIKINGSPRIYGSCLLSANGGHINIDGAPIIHGYVEVYAYDGHNNAVQIDGEPEIYARSCLTGRCKIGEKARVHGNACIYDDAIVKGLADVSGYIKVGGRVTVEGTARLTGAKSGIQKSSVVSDLSGCAYISDNAVISSAKDMLVLGPFGESSTYLTFYKTRGAISVVIHKAILHEQFVHGIGSTIQVEHPVVLSVNELSDVSVANAIDDTTADIIDILPHAIAIAKAKLQSI